MERKPRHFAVLKRPEFLSIRLGSKIWFPALQMINNVRQAEMVSRNRVSVGETQMKYETFSAISQANSSSSKWKEFLTKYCFCCFKKASDSEIVTIQVRSRIKQESLSIQHPQSSSSRNNKSRHGGYFKYILSTN